MRSAGKQGGHAAPHNKSQQSRALLAFALTLLSFSLALGLGRGHNIWLATGLAAAIALLATVLGLRCEVRWGPSAAPGGGRDFVNDQGQTAGYPPALCRRLLWGAGSGLLMIAATHALYPVAYRLVPPLQDQVRNLYGLLNAPPGPFWALPVLTLVVVAEEILWRGVFLPQAVHHLGPHKGLGLAVGAYALPQLLSGSWLLPLVALSCGLLWSWQAWVSRGILVPLVTHWVWDVGVFVALPLEGSIAS